MSVSKKSIARINKLTKNAPVIQPSSPSKPPENVTPPRNPDDYVKTLPIHLL